MNLSLRVSCCRAVVVDARRVNKDYTPPFFVAGVCAFDTADVLTVSAERMLDGHLVGICSGIDELHNERRTSCHRSADRGQSREG